jgi:hypothetical protein
MALPGLGRALVSAGKLGQKAAEDLYKKAQSSRTSFIAELTGSGAVSACRPGAHHVHRLRGAPARPRRGRRAAAAQRPARPQDLRRLPHRRAQQAQQPADRRHRRPVGPAGGRKDQVRDPDGRGLGDRRVRQAQQTGRSARPPPPPRRWTTSSAATSSSTNWPPRPWWTPPKSHRGRRRAGRQVPAQDADRRLQHARVRPALRALRAHLPRALPDRRRAARDRLTADRHQGQAGLAHQGDLAHGHLREAGAAGRADEAQGRSPTG